MITASLFFFDDHHALDRYMPTMAVYDSVYDPLFSFSGRGR